MIILLGVVLVMSLEGCSSTAGWYHLPTLEFDEVDYGFEVHEAMVDGKTIAYIDEGRGEQTLLLIHGLGTNAKGWQRNIPELSKQYRVIALDLPGYGKSSKDHYPFSMSFHAGTAAGLLAELNIDQAVWVGHSMGGQIAMTAALEQPDRVEALVLLSTAGFEAFEEGEGDWMRNAVTPKFVAESSTRQIARNLHSNFQKTPDEADFFITDRLQIRGAEGFDLYCYAVWQNVCGMLDGPVMDRLDEITQPTLIVFGENDGLIPNPYLHAGFTSKIAEFGQQSITGSDLVLIPSCGHMTMFEKPDEVNAAVRTFVDKL